jgi:hypothetical protein
MPFDNPNIDPNLLHILALMEKARWRMRVPQLWCKGKFRRGTRVCVIGAVEWATFENADRELIIKRLRTELVRAIPSETDWSSPWHARPARPLISYFNDRARTRHRDVMAIWDRAIERQRRRVMEKRNAY